MARPQTSATVTADKKKEEGAAQASSNSTSGQEQDIGALLAENAALKKRLAEKGTTAVEGEEDESTKNVTVPGGSKELFKLGRPFWDGNRMHERGDKLYFLPKEAPNHSTNVNTGKVVKRELKDPNVK